MRSCLILLAVASCAHPSAPAAALPPLDRAVHALCDKRVVLLGEDANHGGAATLATKTALAMRLVDECQFSAIAFEASLPELVGLERARRAGTATRAQVADAVGGLWSSDALTSALFERNQLVLVGLDGQVGASDRFVQTSLAGELAGHLAEPRASACRAELQRNAEWGYDDASPYDDGARERLHGCLTEIDAAADGEGRAMASAWRSAVDASDPTRSDTNVFNARDRAMAQALDWQLSRLPPGCKVIVWCATIHAAKSLRGIPALADRQPLGSYVHRELGDAAASIGVSALGGERGRPGHPVIAIPPAPEGSLEARAFAGHDATDLAYLDRRELATAGAARALDYTRLVAAPWGDVVDGMLVLRAERPLTAPRRGSD